MSLQQCAEAVLLVRPAAFVYNRETASSNAFQQPRVQIDSAVRAAAEFDQVAAAIAAAGVIVCVAEDSREPLKPDAVFPNNWISWHRDGTVVLYPMLAINRRAERRADVIDLVGRSTAFNGSGCWTCRATRMKAAFWRAPEVWCWIMCAAWPLRVARRAPTSRWSSNGHGSWVTNRIVFDARTAHGASIYHTNVMLAIGTAASWSVPRRSLRATARACWSASRADSDR